jgi:hypothetical protein
VASFVATSNIACIGFAALANSLSDMVQILRRGFSPIAYIARVIIRPIDLGILSGIAELDQ